MSISIDVEIKETVDQIQRKIMVEIRNHLNIVFPKIMNSIESVIKQEIYEGVISQPEYQSLVNGTLRIDLGLVDGVARIVNIIDIWLDNLEIKFVKFRAGVSNLTGGIIVQAIDSSYSDVLNSNDAIFITEKGEQLPWLEWLLLSGSERVIANYSVNYKIGTGRTGGGTMINIGSWGIPIQFSGKSKNNFITRAIESRKSNIESRVNKILEKNI